MGDFSALITEPSEEYFAQAELQRFGLQTYLPQCRRRFTSKRSTVTVMRRFPLFPNYLLIELDDVDHPMIREVRGLRRAYPVLRHSDVDGTPWRAPEQVIAAIRTAEAAGQFDEAALGIGDRITMRTGILRGVEAVVGKRQAAKSLEILLPLFNGSIRATVSQGAVMRG